MGSDHRMYKESGRVSVLLVLAVPIMGAVVYGLSFVYSYIIVFNPFIYFNALLFCGYCVVLAALTVGLVKLSKSRNTIVSALFGMLVGLTALYLSWAIFIEALVDDVVVPLSQPSFVWVAMQGVSESGWYSIFGWTPTGGVLWVIWGLEAIGLVFIPVVAVHEIASTSVFCETCKAWAHEETGVLVFTHSDREALEQHFMNQDLSFLDGTAPIGDREAEYYKIDAEWCRKCEDLFTLSLRAVTRTWDDKGTPSETVETIFEDLLVRRETHDLIVGAQNPTEVEAGNGSEVA